MTVYLQGLAKVVPEMGSCCSIKLQQHATDHEYWSPSFEGWPKSKTAKSIIDFWKCALKAYLRVALKCLKLPLQMVRLILSQTEPARCQHTQSAPSSLGYGSCSLPVNHGVGLSQLTSPLGSQGMPCQSTEPAGMHSWQPFSLCRFHYWWWRHDPIYYHLPGEYGHFTQLRCRVFPSGIILVSSLQMGFLVCHSIPS